MSSSTQKKFPTAKDPNDPDPLNFEPSLNLSNPKATLTSPRNPTKIRKIFPDFITHTVPDITPNTRILAAVGTSQAKASPTIDGWLLSDFFAFWHMLRGMTKKQTWMHCVDLDELVGDHARYLHGSPFYPRKVVLDEEILRRIKKDPSTVMRVDSLTFKSEFQERIKMECQEAERAGDENVLILIFGHGEIKNHGIRLGTGHSSTFNTKMLKETVKGINVNITILNTASFSGGWACEPDINATTLAAAGEYKGSISRRNSAWSGRAAGSMFTTAVIDKMMRVGADRKPLITEDDELTEDQEELYANFVTSVYENLLNNSDRRGYEHGIVFGAKDDAWEMCWSERTGIPLGNFEERWTKLPDWPADETVLLGDVVDRDPSVTKKQEQYLLEQKKLDNKHNPQRPRRVGAGESAKSSTLGKRNTSGLYGGTQQSLISKVCALGGEYLSSYRGFDDSGNDGGFHNTIYRIIAGQEKNQERIETVLENLKYRMQQMSTADGYLEAMDIPPPQNLRCCEFDTKSVLGNVGKLKYGEFQRMMVYENTVLFPDPVEKQGGKQGGVFYKGIDYLIAAFHSAGLSEDAVARKLNALAEMVDEDVTVLRAGLEEISDVASKRLELSRAVGWC